MHKGAENPGFQTLLDEQAHVQAGKFPGRTLEEYNANIFPGQRWLKPRSSNVVDFLKPLCRGGGPSLENLINGLCQARNRGIKWVDMGGGRAFAMRQVANTPSIQDKVTMTNIDLFNMRFDGLGSDEIGYLEELCPGITDIQDNPFFIQANVESVILPKPVDLLTAVEVMQYLDSPLAAICNWYNQLEDDGLFIIAAEDDFASWVRYQREPRDPNWHEVPMKHFLGELTKKGIKFAATPKADSESGERPDLDPNNFRILVVQKKPGTELRVNQDPIEVWVNPYNYKAVYYDVPVEGRLPLIQVLSLSDQTKVS